MPGLPGWYNPGGHSSSSEKDNTMSSMAVPRYTPEQYLDMERRAQTKSEYYHGEIFAMAGASWNHTVLVSNIDSLCNMQMQGRPCQAVTNDLRVQVGAAYYYPDVAALCGEPEFTDGHFDTLLNPMAIAEVLSPSTEAYDRGLKFVEYRRAASLQEYVLVAQDAMRIEVYVRQDDTHWLLQELNQSLDVLKLESIGCAIALADIYRNVRLAEAPD